MNWREGNEYGSPVGLGSRLSRAVGRGARSYNLAIGSDGHSPRTAGARFWVQGDHTWHVTGTGHVAGASSHAEGFWSPSGSGLTHRNAKRAPRPLAELWHGRVGG
jgi:hypothetical protein